MTPAVAAAVLSSKGSSARTAWYRSKTRTASIPMKPQSRMRRRRAKEKTNRMPCRRRGYAHGASAITMPAHRPHAKQPENGSARQRNGNFHATASTTPSMDTATPTIPRSATSSTRSGIRASTSCRRAPSQAARTAGASTI